ncbi:DNA (cytosine-5-)-methyltransferase [Mycolicibacterium sp. 120270]|uniref:DNA (cytosine-5-)-methyltransferase n=1 Tax=Mycolicibacterium sp. 120270 TaxID=3090600 RepID=UPI00299E2DD9|nr:DNA (cytosine-5-)-methyltransferase [Mycolicibacterium sp. 120270]MDX1883243.1 DNA (cytosine-5-)-methyltransferase [Mycolicibacterium sp. 120270]
MARPSSKASKAHEYGVKLVRGPFVNLPPHREHTDDVDKFVAYAARLKSTGARLAADFFSGAGGLSLGLEKAGFRVVLGADHEPFAIRTHAHHFGGMSVDWDLSEPAAIARVVDLCTKAGVELIAGGPPCQPFSRAGRSMIRHRVESGLREPRDERRDLWRSFVEIVQGVLPRAVVMENVPDMALDREMFILRSVVETLEQLGYSVEERVVDTWRYGVPQFRQRLVLVALRNNVKFTWPKESARKVTVWNAIGDLPEVEGGWRPEGGEHGWAEYSGPITQFQREMRSRVNASDAGKVYDHITRPVREDDRQAFDRMTHATKYTDLDREHQRYRGDIFDDKYNRLNENDLSRTITAHIAKDGYWYIHPRQSRTLTVREAARLQTFPDDFRFDGPPSAAFRQIGNAVPPQLGFAIGRAVLSSLDSASDAGITTRETAQTLAKWMSARLPSLSMPWLRAKTRWQIIVAELLLDRASPSVSTTMWRFINQNLVGPEAFAPGENDELAEQLVDLATGIGRRARAEKVIAIAESLNFKSTALDGSAEEMKQATGLTDGIADLAELAVEVDSAFSAHDNEISGEPVLVTKGILRVARRFQANPVDRRNKMTDGRLAVARMIGFGPSSRLAHLGMIELANSICRPEVPLCGECPLVESCARDGFGESIAS